MLCPPPVRTEPLEVQLRFTYDPLGRRLTKHYKETSVIPYPDTESISNHIEYHHRYLYAGENIVAIYDNDTDELLATLLHDEGVDTPLSISQYDKGTLSPYELEAMSEDERYLYTQSLIRTYYYHRDHQNSILALSDKNAQIVEYYEYDAYGNITKSEHTEGIQTLNPYRYTGREYDTDDLYYYRARYYDPTIGRFITPDPIGFLGGDMNFYRYVGNDPVNFVDYSGFSAQATGGVHNFSGKTLRDTLQPHLKSSTPQKPKPSKGGGSAQVNKGDGAKIAGTPPKPKEECCKKPVPEMPKGSCDYYKKRNDNFIERHKPCANKTPPDYYLNYGYKYCSKFKTETYPNLSPAGQVWLNETLQLLQVFMDQGLVSLNYTSKNNEKFTQKVIKTGLEAFYTGIECRNADHRYFAFATHPDAYRPKDMKTLPCSDLIKIAKTPDWKEWLDGATWEQVDIMREKMGVWETMKNCTQAEAHLRTDQITNTGEALVKSIRSLFQ